MSSNDEHRVRTFEPDAATSRWLHGRVIAQDQDVFVLRLASPTRWTAVPAVLAGALAILATVMVFSSKGWALFLGWLACLVAVPAVVTVIRYGFGGARGPLRITDRSVTVPYGPFSSRKLMWYEVTGVHAEGRRICFVLGDDSRVRARNGGAPADVSEGLVAILERIRSRGRCGFLHGLARRKGLERWTTATHSGIELDLSPVFKPVPLLFPILGGLGLGAMAMWFGGSVSWVSALVALVLLAVVARVHPDGASRGARSVQLSIDAIRLQVEVGLPFGRSHRWQVPISSITDVRGAGNAIVVQTTEGTHWIPLRERSLATVSDTAGRIREALASVDSPAGSSAVPYELERLTAGSQRTVGQVEGGPAT